MVGRRKPLVLASTKTLLNSVLSSSRLGDGERVAGDDDDDWPRGLQLPAGILRCSEAKLASLDDSALVGVSISVLKRLSITSGSSVCFFLFPFLHWFCLVAAKKKKNVLVGKLCLEP